MAKQKTLDEVKKLGLENLAALLETSLDEDKEEDTNTPEIISESTTDINTLFEGLEGLPEGFADKAKTLFEAAVAEKALAVSKDAMTKLEEDVAAANEAQIEKDADQLDAYLSFVTEQWFEENQPIVESKMKVELAENFVSGITKLLAEYNVEILPEQQDKVAELETKLAEQEQEIEELVNALAEAKRTNDRLACESIIAEAIDGMTDVEAERFTQVLSEMDYVTAEDFSNKVDVLKAVFTGKEVRNVVVEAKESEVVLKEDIDIPSGGAIQEKELSASMKSYVSAIKSSNTRNPK